MTTSMLASRSGRHAPLPWARGLLGPVTQ
jgi:hypothetical protein